MANSLAVIIDANILIAICSQEEHTYEKALDALNEYAVQGANFYAPNVLVAEVLFVLCQKLVNGTLTDDEHGEAVEFFQEYLGTISPPPNGEASLVQRAEESRKGYGCSRSADGLYIALAEELSGTHKVEFLTLDRDLEKQMTKIASNIPVKVP